MRDVSAGPLPSAQDEGRAGSGAAVGPAGGGAGGGAERGASHTRRSPASPPLPLPGRATLHQLWSPCESKYFWTWIMNKMYGTVTTLGF